MHDFQSPAFTNQRGTRYDRVQHCVKSPFVRDVLGWRVPIQLNSHIRRVHAIWLSETPSRPRLDETSLLLGSSANQASRRTVSYPVRVQVQLHIIQIGLSPTLPSRRHEEMEFCPSGELEPLWLQWGLPRLICIKCRLALT